MACLYKTMDSPLDQWAPVVVISSRLPWKPVVSDQPGEAGGGVWIEVARRARRFADGPEPERAGEGTTRLLCQPVWGTSPLRNTGRVNWMFYSAFSFAFTRHSGLSDRRFFLDHTGKFFHLVVVARTKNRAQKNKLHNEIGCAHARKFWLLYLLYFYNIKLHVREFLFTLSERKVLSFVMWPLGSEVAVVVRRFLSDIPTFT